MRSLAYYISALLLLFCTQAIAQNGNILNHHIPYSSYDQNMWGPDTAYGIDVQHTFFDVNINENWGFSEITSFFGQQLGVGFETGIQALLASSYEAQGFYTGEIDIDYPVDITLDFPDRESFDYGEITSIHTSYDVAPGWDLSTDFPPVGITTLDLEYMIDPYMDLIICVFGCDTTHLIPPSLSVPYTHDTLFHINGYTGYTIYPCYVNGNFQYCHDTTLPIEIPDMFNIGISAWVTLPYVETTDHLDTTTNCLIAEGDSLYMNVNVDILQFIHSAASLIPPPTGPNIQQTINFLSDTISYPINTPLGNITAVIAYDLLSAEFDTYNYMKQEIEFCPTIWANLSFPVEMPYSITDPANGNAIYTQGTQDTMRVPVGHDLNIKYPCHGTPPYKDSMYVGVEYDITPTISNHTYDSIAFTITIDALSVSVTIQTPFKQAIDSATLPEFNIPNVENNKGNQISLNSPAVHSPGVSLDEEEKNAEKDIGPFDIGPLFSWEIPIGSAELTWFDETWEMENFTQDTVFPGTYIVPFDKSELNLNMYHQNGSFCYGDSAGYIFAQTSDEIEPLTYVWSTGDVHNGVMDGLDSLLVAPGFYSVTATNNYGCTTEDTYTVSVNPPIIHSLSGEDILCHGDNTGSIFANVSGGTYPYHFDWSYGTNNDGIGHDTATNLPSGWHSVTITDWEGCSVTDSIYLSQPATPLSVTDTTTAVTCHDDTDGTISVNMSGATPPYNIVWDNNSMSGTYIEDVAGGTYTATITDDNGCELIHDVTVPQPDSLDAVIVTHNIDCNDNGNGSLGVHTEGGTPQYQYNWFFPSLSGDTLSNLDPGLYVVTVVDSHGCEDTAMGLITQPGAITLDLHTQGVSCNGYSDGWMSLNPSGGTPFPGNPSYQINWSNNLDPGWEDIDSVYSIPADNYYVTITDNHGCQYIDTIMIPEPDLIQVNWDKTNISCNGMEDGSVIANVTGGTQPYDYSWNDGNDCNDSLAYNLDANVQYELEITDANGCRKYAWVSLSEPAPLDIINESVNPVICGISAGTGHAEAGGGTQPYTFTWSNGETGTDPDSLPLGKVSVTVTDVNDCTDTTSLIVNKTGDISANASIIDEILCYGNSTARIAGEMPDGFEPLTFNWYNDNGELVGSEDTISDIPAGGYELRAYDKFKCADTLTIQVEQPDSINPGLNTVQPSCTGEENGEIKTNVSGGTAPYNYVWSTGSTDPEIESIREGTYYLTITDYNNCEKEVIVDLDESEYCLIIHNTITPNGDGKNDTWVIEKISEFKFAEVWIYNRNGQELFYSDNYKNDWNGEYKGNELPSGTYFYVVDPGTGKEVKKGYLTIIR